jgi:two-component system sensor histidine kinase UhpB
MRPRVPTALKPSAPRSSSLFWRVAITNGVIFSAGVLLFALSPATVSSPVAADEAAVLAAGTIATVAANLFALRRALAPLAGVAEQMASVDPLSPATRVGEGDQYREIAAITASFNEMVDRLAAERRDSSLRTLRAEEAERTRLTRELHDEVGQTLTVLLLQLMHAAKRAGDDAQPSLELAQETARDALEEVRRIGQRLRPESLDDLGLPTALVTLADRVSGAAGLDVRAEVAADLPELDQEAALAVFRIAQESLTNVVRHAGAGSASVRLERAGDGVALSVRDDGRGAAGIAGAAGATGVTGPTAAPTGVSGGIRGMRERALAVGGRLTLDRPAGGGFEVRLELPPAAVAA